MVNRSKDFEKFIHNHTDIKKNKAKLINHMNEQELFLIGKDLSYKNLIDIIEQNIKYYNDYSNIEKQLEQAKLEIEKLNLVNNMNNSTDFNNFIQIFTNTFDNLSNKIDNLDTKITSLETVIKSNQYKTTTNFNEPLITIGDKLQKINPETLQLVKVYNSIAECIQEDYTIKRSSINKAINECTIYHNFRWALVDKELDANVINIKPTKVTRIQHIGYIAKLNKTKTSILAVYLDRKTIATKYNIPISTIESAVKNCTLLNNSYYILYNELTKELKDTFIRPILYKDGIGKYDSSNVLVKEFTSKNDCVTKETLGNKSLTRVLDKNLMYDNHYYKSLGTKLFI
jgi:hypothetical protein